MRALAQLHIIVGTFYIKFVLFFVGSYHLDCVKEHQISKYL